MIFHKPEKNVTGSMEDFKPPICLGEPRRFAIAGVSDGLALLVFYEC